jgi:hypothetical protein
MPIDYSQSEWRTLFANYGLTAHAAQVLEKTLLLLLAAVHFQGEGQRPPGDLHAFLDQNKRKSVSDIIKALKQKLPAFPPGLDTDLQEVFRQRNDVIHHFFLDRFDGRDWAQPPAQMDRELRPICERLRSLQDRVEALLDQIPL